MYAVDRPARKPPRLPHSQAGPIIPQSGCWNSGCARTLLRIAAKNPRAVLDVA
jgi:hypothetical protein